MNIRVECLGILPGQEDNNEDYYYVRLQEIGGEKRKVDIAVPENVAYIIESVKQNVPLPTDLQTYSMIHSMLIKLGATVKKVVMTKVEGESLCGLVWTERDKKTFVEPAGAGDILALAAITQCPIYIKNSTFDNIEKLQLKREEEDRIAFLEDMSEDNPQ